MNDASRSRPSTPTLAAGAAVFLGVVLWMFAGKQFLFIAALGAFGPGIARELGLLSDEDEFQRAAARRAGYHAYLAGGLATATVVSLLHRFETVPRFPAELMTWVLVVMWLTWLFSSMLNFWSAPKMTRAVLGSFGGFWALFVTADLVSGAGTGSLTDTLLGVGVAIGILGPFVSLAWAAPRWPRHVGWLLLLAGIGLTVVFFRPVDNLAISTQLFTFTLLVAPLLACGVAMVQVDEAESVAP